MLIVVFVLVGVVVILWGCARGSWELAAAGGIPSVLFWPALSEARKIRRENIAIRALEIPLSRSGNAKAAAETLREVFVNVFGINGR